MSSPSPAPAPQRVEQIDSNFKAAEAGADRLWIDAFDCRVALRGLGWLDENRKTRGFRRLPDRAEAAMNPGVQTLSHHSSSVFLSFATDSPHVSVEIENSGVEVMNHMPSTGSRGAELYFRDGNQWLAVATAVPDLTTPTFRRDLLIDLPSKMREFRLYLPLYHRPVSVRIGVAEGAAVQPIPAPAGQKPIFFYGTSITQGGCANTAGSDYVSILGRLLDREVINFGFSGNGKGEPEVAELISEIDAEMFVLDYVANVPTAELLGGTLEKFIPILRARHPETPVVLLGGLFFDRVLGSRESWEVQQAKRDIVLDLYLRFRKAGDPNLHYIDGFSLLGPGVTASFVDGIHPTSAGFLQMAERLAPQLRAIQIWNRDFRAR